jgi:glycosyltransferase involved in cell wall biosynthesis
MTNEKSKMTNSSSSRVAIVHDWLVGGGAEHVVYELHKMYPKAPIYTAYCNEASRRVFKNAEIHVSFMQKFPFSKLRKFLPILRQYWFENLDLKQFDLVISSSGAEAKAARTRPDAVHINYCHSPTHYYWSRYDQYMAHPGLGWLDPIARLGLKLLIKPNRHWDYGAAQHPNFIVANSTSIQKAIKLYYNRDSEVIHPPVDTKHFKVANQKAADREGFVVAGRLTPYKRIDLAVRACTKENLPLTVIGNGPDFKKLKRMAGPTITFTGFLTRDEVASRFQKAIAFIMPNEDDFGITPVEALAAGTPVIAFKAGGALDYLTPGKNGEFFDEQTVKNLSNVLKNFRPEKYNQKIVAESAEQFSIENFHKNMTAFIKKVTSQKN